MATITLSIPDELVQRLDRLARSSGVTRSAFVERAITETVERDAESALRTLGALRTRSEDGPPRPLPADVLVAKTPRA